MMHNQFSAKKPPPDVNPRAVFANNEIHLGNVSIYGFDYDYTLAHYKPSMHHLIYDLGKKALVEQFKVCWPAIPFLTDSALPISCTPMCFIYSAVKVEIDLINSYLCNIYSLHHPQIDFVILWQQLLVHSCCGNHQMFHPFMLVFARPTDNIPQPQVC